MTGAFGSGAGGVGRTDGAANRGGGTERYYGAAHEFKGEERETVLKWRSAIGRLGKTGEDAVERDRLLRVVTRLREWMLLRKGGDLGEVVWALGKELLAPHIDVERVK